MQEQVLTRPWADRITELVAGIRQLGESFHGFRHRLDPRNQAEAPVCWSSPPLIGIESDKDI